MPNFTLHVNGNEKNVSVEADTPLLWVLRDTLELTGTKFGCGAGYCGACSVHVNGALTHSCTMAVSQAAGKNVTTIEGLGANGLHALQKAWIAEDVPNADTARAVRSWRRPHCWQRRHIPLTRRLLSLCRRTSAGAELTIASAKQFTGLREV